MTQGIYLITNTVNNRHYVGQSKDIETRWGEHKRSTFNCNATDYETPLHRAFRKHGVDNFTFEVLEVVPNHSELNSIENKYIAKYNSIAKGYNQIVTSRNGLSKEDLNKKREERYGVTKEKLKTQLIESNFEAVAKSYGVSSNAVRKWCKDYDLPTTAKAYHTPEKDLAYRTRMSKISRESSTKKKRIAMIDKDTAVVIKEFDSVREASEYIGTSTGNITRAVYGYEGRTTSYGYRWSYIK